MGRRNKNKSGKHISPMKEDSNYKNFGNSKEQKFRKQSKKDHQVDENQRVDFPTSNKVIPIITTGLKWVAYKELFPTKIVTGTKIKAALERYNLRKNKDINKSSPDQGQDDISSDIIDDMRQASSKKQLLKMIKGEKKPKVAKKTRIKGGRLPREPIFQLSRLGPEEEEWFPPVPGIDGPLIDEVVGNLNKPRPRDPEREAILDRIPMPTPKEIERQFKTKRSILPRDESNEWYRELSPEEKEEVLRTRTTLADLKHFYETGELIERK